MKQISTAGALRTDAHYTVEWDHASTHADKAALHATFTAAVGALASGLAAWIETGTGKWFRGGIDLSNTANTQHVTSTIVPRRSETIRDATP